MTESKISTTLKTGRERLTAMTSEVRERLVGRSRQVVGIAALAGIAGAGLTAAAIAHPNDVTPAAVSATTGASADRQGAADRANRDSRPEAPASKSASPQATATKKAAPKYSSPMPGAAVTSCYGQRWGVLHAGIDFASAENTPIHSVVGGTVFSSGWAYSGYGISVVVDHGNGYFTHYAHMNKAAVKVGQKVAAGTVLGYEGSTGDSTGPHLHFEVHKGMWNQINPAAWLAARGVATNC